MTTKATEQDTADSSKKKQDGTFDLLAEKKKEGGASDSFLRSLLRRGDDNDDGDEKQDLKENDEEKEEDDTTPAITHDEKPPEGPWAGLGRIVTQILSSKHDEEQQQEDSKQDRSIESVVQKARVYASSGDFSETKSGQDLDHLRTELDRVLTQLKQSFDHVGLEKINPISFFYYLEQEESVKTPSWKRRKHRFLPSLDLDTVHALHDALYLSELSYMDTVEDIQAGLKGYQGSPYEMIYCTTESQPREPAHFIAIQKHSSEPKEEGFRFPWESKSDKFLEVLFVVRGTKDLADMLSDALLDASDYRDGKAHNGVAEAGRYLVNKHTDLLELLLEQSGYNKIRLTLIGHSLGAGAAAIAAMEFNDHPHIEATCVGFGCPALLNKELSEQTKEYITTVVSDSDVVPRMSGASVANMLLNVMSLDFTDKCVADLDELLQVARGNVPFPIPDDKIQEVNEWARTEIERRIKSAVEEVPRERSPIVLYPPGKCIHLYRDGVGISANYVPCDFFDAIDVSRTMVEDHYIATGYNRLLIELMRDHYQDSKFDFRHDVAGLRIEKDKRNEAGNEKE